MHTGSSPHLSSGSSDVTQPQYVRFGVWVLRRQIDRRRNCLGSDPAISSIVVGQPGSHDQGDHHCKPDCTEPSSRRLQRMHNNRTGSRGLVVHVPVKVRTGCKAVEGKMSQAGATTQASAGCWAHGRWAALWTRIVVPETGSEKLQANTIFDKQALATSSSTIQ